MVCMGFDSRAAGDDICFVDVEGTKNVKQMISLLAITGQFILSNRCGSYRRILATGSRCS